MRAVYYDRQGPADQVLQLGVVFGDQDRVGGVDQRGRRRQQDPLGLRADIGKHGGWRRGEKGRVVVLSFGGEVQADVLCVLGT